MKKHLFISMLTVVGIIGLLIALFLFILWPFRGIGGKTDYNEARTRCIEIFDNKKEEFISAKNSIIVKGTAEDIKIKKVESINYNRYDTIEIVEFYIGSQGMLGGQYWGIYYSPDDTPYFENIDLSIPDDVNIQQVSNIYIWKKVNRNYIFASERITANWFFFYEDYDGNRHGISDIA